MPRIEIVDSDKLRKQFLLLCGDSKDVLKDLPDNFVNTVVTSPPYWQLRDYFADDQLGQEATPEEYVENLVYILREVKRVLRKDGSLWLNMGDGYNNSSGFERTTDWKRKGRKGGSSDKKSFKHKSIKTKDLVGMPWLVAKALQEPYYTGSIKKEIDRAWLASMIDGEGSISGFTHDRKDGDGIRRGINIHITNSNMDLLDNCFRIWPLALKQKMKKNEGHLGDLDIYRWIPNGVKDKASLMAEIYPYLIAKKKQALLAWNFLQISKDARGRKAHKENQDKCKWIVENLSKLNHQKNVDIPKWIKEPESLYEDGWYLRCDIIWCLSGGSEVYIKSNDREFSISVRDLYRLDPSTVKLWNGEIWTQMVGIIRTPQKHDEIQFELRSGERICCTPNHKWPTERGVVKTRDLVIGDIIKKCSLPEPKNCSIPDHLPDEEIGWFIGIYLAEGSRSGKTIQISSHKKEVKRFEKLKDIVKKYHGTCHKYETSHNGMTINIHSDILNSVIDMYIGGKVAKDKYLSSLCWQRNNIFLKNILEGYLEGDGHFDAKNNRYRLGFIRNYCLERSLRTICARLNVFCTIKLAHSKIKEKTYKTFKGEIRFKKNGHFNCKNISEIVKIETDRGGREYFYDIEVEDEPNLFSLSSGILTHNSKTNPMPDGVKDRPTRGHEYVFLLTKSPRYYYDYYRVLEDTESQPEQIQGFGANEQHGTYRMDQKRTFEHYGKRNRRSVWRTSVSTFKGKHFACVDEETECLTKRGWKKHFELKDGEDIASFDINSEKIKWTKLLNVSTYDYVGDLVEITKPSLNFLMTPNHRVIHKAYNGRARKYTELRIKEADELSNSDRLPIAADWEVHELKSEITKNMSELLGWISSDGGYDKYNVKIYQSTNVNRDKVERIRFLLDDLEIDYKYNIRNRFFISQKNNKKREFVEAIFSINSSDSKKIKKIMPLKKPTIKFMNESDEIIKCFLNGFIGGDGHIRKDDGRKSITQKDKDTMDILQMLCFKVGYSTNLKQRKDKKWNLYIRKNKFSGIRNTNGKKIAITKTHYKGVVWCPSTRYTTFVARRNGNIMITGNTYPPALIDPMIAASTSEKGCCANCGTPWFRNFEKEKKVCEEVWTGQVDAATEESMTDTGSKKGYTLQLVDKGWEKGCKCDTDEVKPGIVLDPFNGSGTTGKVALKYDQSYIGIDTNDEYLDIARKNIAGNHGAAIVEAENLESFLDE